MSKKCKKKKESTWDEVIWYGLFGTIIDFIFTIHTKPGMKNIHLSNIGNGNLDEWGRNKATLIRSLLVFVLDIICAYALDYPSAFASDSKNRITASYCLITVQIIIAIICLVVIYIKAKYKRDDKK